MRLLLDTHALVWFYLDDLKLPTTAKTAIIDPANDVSVSPASYWEIAIKVSLGKFVLKEPYPDFIQHAIRDNGFDVLPIEPTHTEALLSLPFHHKDPFDRLLIAQAQVEQLQIVSGDVALDAYGIGRVW